MGKDLIMKVMIFGTWDREDGGLMLPTGFIVPDDIKTYEEMYNWLKGHPDFLPKLIDQHCQYEYNEDLEEEITLTIDDLVSDSWEYGVVLEFEKDDYGYTVNLSVDDVIVYDVKQNLTKEENNG
jgi:hypothetical protein